MKRQSETNIVDFEEETNSDSELKIYTPFLFYILFRVWLTFFWNESQKCLWYAYFQKLILTWISFKQC